MEDPTTIALNLTFFATLAVAFVMFFGLFLVFVATLVIAGLGRLVAVLIVATVRSLSGSRSGPVPGIRTLRSPDTAESARPATPATPAGAPAKEKPARPEPALSPAWVDAVARADARAAAKAKAETAPAVKVSVRDLPSPNTPVQDVTAVGPLVASATDRNSELGTAPHAFTKPPMPAAKSVLDTGSLVSLPGQLPLPTSTPRNNRQHQPQADPQAQERKAG